MGANRSFGRRAAALALACLVLAGCTETQSGPVRVVAIGPPPQLVDPSRQPLGPASAILIDTVAQGLVRFDAAGEIEPALAQSWIVSDDGRRYTFRLRRTLWTRGERVTAKQVVERLQAAVARNSRNPLRPVLGAIEQIEAMTEQVLEIRLKAPRPNLLALLAQPELGIIAQAEGTGPYRLGAEVDGALRLIPPAPDEDADATDPQPPEILLSAGATPVALAQFAQGEADLVTGGTLGDVPLLAAAALPADRAVYDPTRGLFGLLVTRADGPMADPRFRHALSMALDRDAIRARFGTATLQPRASILPNGLGEAPAPGVPDWAGVPLAARRAAAARIVAELADVERPRLRVALSRSPGHRILFAHLRRDWRTIGVEAVAVAPDQEAELRLIDEVAPADLVPWYLRHFQCGSTAVCDAAADQLVEAARNTLNPAERQALLAQADRLLVAAAPFLPIGQPVRWSVRSERLNGFRPNVYARHPATELIQLEDR
jgi:peptide/nickel transport system substrate-binding protein